MRMYDTPQPVEKYLNTELECECGQTHCAPIKAVVIKKDAFEDLPLYMKKFSYEWPYLLCDKTTFEIAGRKCEEILSKAGFLCYTHIIEHLGYDEATLGEIVLNKPDNCDLLIACGTGSITDIVRFACSKLHLPCFSAVTAAPMDGFSASVGIMNVNGLKTTIPAHCTEAIFGDSDILRRAPFRMTLAGFSDLIAKLNAIDDWRLAAVVDNGHYCKKIDELICFYVEGVLNEAESLKGKNEKAIGDLLNALILTGASISLYGNSRPVSGAEHHMSHYWDLLSERRGKPFAMHGEQAGVGTVIALRFAKELLNTPVDFDAARRSVSSFERTHWENDIRRTYGAAADTVIRDEDKAGFVDTNARLERIDRIEENWQQIKEMLAGLYPADRLEKLMRDLGCPSLPADIGVDRETLRDTLMHCKETRPRYTILRLAWDLAVFEEVIDKVVKAIS